ncbi:MAG: ABC transporter permease, partial [Steroidobacteraceae bacterium]
ASQVLAADLRLGSPQPLAAEYFREAARRGVRTARVTSMLSVVFRGDSSKLADLHAVTPGYPLRGTVEVAAEPFAAGTPARGIPGRGEAWPSSQLLAALGGHVGSELSIGAATFRVTRVLISRPDQGSTFADLAPGILLNAADLPATRLIQPGSRVSYAGLFAADHASVEAFRRWLLAHERPREHLRDITEASPQVKDAMDRAGRFLELATLASVLLSAIAVAMAARQYVRRHLDTVALLKTLGATRALTLCITLIELLAIAVAAALVGSAVGFLAQEWLIHVLHGLITARLPAPGLAPVGMGFIAAVAVLGGFALPPLLTLSRVPPIRVLRRDVGPPPISSLLAYGPAAAAVLALTFWAVGNFRLFVDFLVGGCAFALVLIGAGLGLTLLAGRFRGGAGISWRYGIANLSRRRADSVVQIIAFGAGLMLLLLLGIVRRDLVADWRRALPVDAPNYFFINISPDDRHAFVEFLESRGARLTRVLPMLRGRLVRIGGRPVDQIRFRGASGRRFAEREQNMTRAAALAAGNRIVAGRWWR